ncbi:MAG: hypothetical protein ACR2QJ_11185 [Geminicoccaceae bacterium]
MRAAIPQTLKRVVRAIPSFITADKRRYFASATYKRLYHVHIRKCGGTSVNMMFLKQIAGQGDAEDAYDRLSKDPDHRVVVSGIPIVGWNQRMIERGAYGFGFSHIPYHEMTLPKDTYSFLLLRDPASRVVSHYAMLRSFIERSIAHPCLKVEGYWAEDGFDAFLERVPREHLERQLYMLDRHFAPDRALRRLSTISNVKMLSDLDRLVAEINDEFQLNLKPIHTRKAATPFRPDDTQRQKLEGLLEAEYRFLEKAREAGTL